MDAENGGVVRSIGGMHGDQHDGEGLYRNKQDLLCEVAGGLEHHTEFIGHGFVQELEELTYFEGISFGSIKLQKGVGLNNHKAGFAVRAWERK
jgi:hypothetical protein